MKRSFQARYVEIKKKTVNLYVIVASLDEQFHLIKDEQEKNFSDAIKYIREERVVSIKDEIEQFKEELIEKLKNVSKGLDGFVIASRIQKLNRLERELQICKECLNDLTEKMNKRWGR